MPIPILKRLLNSSLKNAMLLGAVLFLVLQGIAQAGTPDPPKIQVQPPSPDYLRFLDAYRQGAHQVRTESGRSLGYIPSPLDLSYLKGQRIFSKNENLAIPAAYDLRTYGRMTAVRNQGNCGSCWAFACTASLESTLLTAETRDFSEMNLKNDSGFDLGCCNGGSYPMCMAYFGRLGRPLE